MKFDTIIIGGGLSGLVAGITLLNKGQKCMIISTGQSALHFFSGSIELYATDGNPFNAIAQLPDTHPYTKIGVDALREMAQGIKPFFQEMGIILNGELQKNHYRITPLGTLKPAWLTMEEYVNVPDNDVLPVHRVALLNLEGFLDFHANFLAAGLAHKGIESKIYTVSLPELERIRKNPTEMRSTNIAKILSREVIDRLAAQINLLTSDAELILMPAVVGLTGREEVNILKDKVYKPLRFIPTMPPSVPGIRMQIILRRYFQKWGGVYLLGDTVIGGKLQKNRLASITTANHGDMRFEADNYIFATGNFFSRGLQATADRVVEPILGLDVDSLPLRSEWYHEDFFKAQPYMKFGIATDRRFHVMKDGTSVGNAYAIGSALSGFNAIKEGCGGGVALMSALHVARQLLKGVQ